MLEELTSSIYMTKHPYLVQIVEADSKDSKIFICNLFTDNQRTEQGKPREIIGGSIY